MIEIPSFVNETCERRSIAAEDGINLSYRRWFWKRPKAICICVAGVESHGGWYGASSLALHEFGFSVYFLDRRGSGLSAGERGDAKSADILHEDLKRLIDFAKKESGDCPVFLIAISWGAKWATTFCLKYPSLISGLALITPGLVPKVDYTPLGKLSVAVSALLSPNRLFGVPIPDASYFTDNPEGIRFIDEDPLRLRQVTARFCMQSFRLDTFIKRNYRVLSMPTALFLAGKDRIIDNDGVRRLFDGFSSEKKHVSYYKDACHTLEFDSVRVRFVQDLCDWLESLV
ncbi:MAG: alpha/beta fold hydrolase [Candidatus Omnitrophica bacterium]|nr:alpha/beta fold hydrolase [Candidatus Omnitrophota bacterium]